MQKFHPILYSTPMVQGLLEDRKTKTRRTKGLEEININPDDWQFEWGDYALKMPFRFTKKSTVSEESLKDQSFYQAECKCPYGKPGDVLWVRETWNYKGNTQQIAYKANFDKEILFLCGKWKPSLFMPKAACRIFLEITDVRVERLQDISEEDAISEGVLIDDDGFNCYDYDRKDYRFITPEDSFQSLWHSINGPESWEENPFVWVIEFKKINKPENFI